MEKRFVKQRARLGDIPHAAAIAAAAAGYSHARQAAWRLESSEKIAAATREESRKFLRDNAGSISLAILCEVGMDPAQPAGARVQAAKALAELSDIGLTGEQSRKDPGEMDGAELQDMIAKLERQRDALEAIAAGKAKDVTPSTGDVFG